MKITVVTARFPYPLDRGDRLTIYYLLQHFSKRHQVSLVCFTKPDQDPTWIKKIEPFCECIETVPLRRWRAYANCLRGFAGRTPLQVQYHDDPAMHQAVSQVIHQTQPDLLYAHYIRMGRYIEPYREYPRVLAMQLSMTLNYRRLAEHASNWLYKTVYSTEYRRLRRFEANFARQFDKVLLISKNDLNAIAPDKPLKNVFFSPHGVDYDYFSPDPQTQAEANTLIFTGNMKYMPNVDAAIYFCQEILPLVRRQIPEVKLNIVGTNPLPEVQALGQDPYIKVTGRVPDLRTYLNRAQVAIAPMRVAAGLLNKVLEGMAMEKPMVITSVANEGIRAVGGEHLLIADQAQDFADQIVTLLNDPARRRQLGTAARNFVTQEWSWEKHFLDLEHMFCNLVGQSPTYGRRGNVTTVPGWSINPPATAGVATEVD